MAVPDMMQLAAQHLRSTALGQRAQHAQHGTGHTGWRSSSSSTYAEPQRGSTLSMPNMARAHIRGTAWQTSSQHMHSAACRACSARLPRTVPAAARLVLQEWPITAFSFASCKRSRPRKSLARRPDAMRSCPHQTPPIPPPNCFVEHEAAHRGQQGSPPSPTAGV
jgi:hypothetical protein